MSVQDAFQQAALQGQYEGSGMTLPAIPPAALQTGFLLNGHPMDAAAGAPGGGVPDPSKPLSLQDWLALSYLTTALGGSVGQFFKKGVPPPPVGIPQGSPPPPSTPTATQSSLGLAQTRKANRGGFGRG